MAKVLEIQERLESTIPQCSGNFSELLSLRSITPGPAFPGTLLKMAWSSQAKRLVWSHRNMCSRLKLPFQAVEGFKQNIYNVSIGFNEKGGFQQWDGRMDAQFSGKPMPVSRHDFTHFHT